MELGFEAAARANFPFPAVRFDFGNLKLYASESYSKWFEEIIKFDGIKSLNSMVS